VTAPAYTCGTCGGTDADDSHGCQECDLDYALAVLRLIDEEREAARDGGES